MDCPSCGHPNREGARFCADCAAPLPGTLTCPRCGDQHPVATRFCDSCGEPLGSAPAIDLRTDIPHHLAHKIRSSRAVLEGERKQVTVLFADVMGSMDLAERTDAEDWRAIMERFFAILCEGVHRFEGTVDKFTGDGAMALFGAPIAHEDHARRACYAALHLQQQLAAYAGELRRSEGIQLLVRMGLNSGEVVVGAIGEDLGMEYTAVGHTVGLAQRIEALAEPGKIYVSRYTAALVSGYLVLRDLGEFRIKGASHPLEVHELTGVGPARGRLDISRARGLSRFVGREEEMEALDRAREQALEGQGQVAGIVGEAGVGKSRLCEEFMQRHRARGVNVYHVAGQAHAKSVPLMPVLQLMRDYFDVTEVDSDQTARERIAGKLLLLDEQFAADLPLLFDFLGVPDPQRPPVRMDPDARQRQLLSVTKQLIHAQSARYPGGITVIEDLHWFDPASETFLANHVEAVQGTRGLTVVNFRPEYQAPWMSRSYYRQIALAPLSDEAIEQLLADLLGSDPSLDGLPQLIRERTHGNPFFIEEVVQSLVEAGDVAGERGAYRLVRLVERAAVPASVQAVLAGRIDRLGQREKAVLQAAAVIGKEFSGPVLRAALEQGGAELEEALRHLIVSEFIFEHELYPEVIYAFKHPLTQEVAYGSQLGKRRAAMHAAVARAIAEQQPERLDERSALVAQHWEAAGERLEAASWHARAAAWSGTGDPTQSLSHWRKVRELLEPLDATDEITALGARARMFELNFGWRLGISQEEAEAIFTEAEWMASQAGDVRLRALLLATYAAIRGVSDGDLREFAALARRARALAEESHDPALLMGIASNAYAYWLIGAHGEAVAVLDRAIELANGDATAAADLGFVDCPYAFWHGMKGFTLITLGELDGARRLIERGMSLAGGQDAIETVGWTHMWSTWLAYFLSEPELALGHAQQALAIAERIGDAFSHAHAWGFVGLAERMRGEWRQAIDALERSEAISSERRAAVDGRAWRLAFLGESHLGLGDVARARSLAEEAVAVTQQQGALATEPLARIALARVLLASRDTTARAEIDATLAQALAVTRATKARVYEPLIHVEFAELARQGGDEGGRQRALREAHRQLVEIGALGRAERLASDAPLAPDRSAQLPASPAHGS